MADLSGQHFGSYELLTLLARGGMGEVYRARHLRLRERQAAVKVLPAVLAADPDFLRRFEREANNVAALNHPHILPIWDYGDHAGVPYLAMPLVAGGSLRERLRGRSLAPEELLPTIKAIAAALDYAHSRGIVHRDIKPANILFDETDHLYLADFGIARAIEGDDERLTQTGFGIGTPEYMAPEQAQGQAGPRSDVYALAVIAYEGLSGVVPYTGTTPIEVTVKHLTAPLPPLCVDNPALAPALEAVVQRGLAKLPDDRYPTAGAFACDFEGALQTPEAAVLAAERTTTRLVVPPPSPAGLPAGNLPPTPPALSLPDAAGMAPPTPVVRALVPPPRRRAWVPFALAAIVLAVALVAASAAAVTLRGGDAGAGRVPTSTFAATGAATTGAALVTGTRPAAVSPGSAASTATDLPFPFPASNGIFEREHARLSALVQSKAPDARLSTVAVKCYNPRAGADCQATFRYYSRQNDMRYSYSFSLSDSGPQEVDQEPVSSDYERVVFMQPPWQKTPLWSQLIRESYPLLTPDFGRFGFEVELYSDAATSNQDEYDWMLTYVDRDTDDRVSFVQRGSRVRQVSQRSPRQARLITYPEGRTVGRRARVAVHR